MSELQQFELLIKQLMSSDNNLRGQAEQSFNAAVTQVPDTAVLLLLQLIRTGTDQHVRELCTILMRKTLVAKSTEQTSADHNPLQCWNLLRPQTHQTIKQELLLSIENEQLASVRKKLADTVSELALCLCTYNPSEEQHIDTQWPELLPFLFRLSQSQNDEHRRSSLDMFAKLCLYLGDSIKGNARLLKEILTKGLTDQHSLKVRLAALSATVSFIQLLEPNEKVEYKDFTLLMFETVSAALNAQKEQEALEALQILVELADIEPTFLRPHIAVVVNAMLTIANSAQLSSAIRQLGLEFLITLAEQRAGMVRKIDGFVQNLVPVILNFMLDLDEEWSLEEDDEDELEVTNHDVGDECLDRLALALGGKTIAPILFNLVPAMLSHQDWKHRHTGLMAISLVGEGCERFLTPHLQNVLGMIVPHFSDPHPRVRWAACNTIGQMSSDFGPAIQRDFHSTIIPCLVQVMDDKSHPRVQSHAASAIINFCEHCTPEILAPFLDGLLIKLAGLLQGGKRIVQEQAITAIAAMADVAKENFVKYYDNFMPYLKAILSNATGTDYRLLRGKAMECISLIAVAVGKDKFLPDAKEVIDALLITQQSKLEPDDPQISFLLQAWARICKAIGPDFVPYLDVVMPPLLAAASQEPDLTVTGTDEEGESQQDGWQYIPIGDKRIGINTSTMEEKATACNMILQYATDLQDGFFKYVEPVATALLPLTKFYFHDGVRSAAVSTMPALLESVKLHMVKSNASLQPVHTLFGHVLVYLLEAISAEVDMDIELIMIDALSECLDTCEANCMNELQIKTLVETVKIELEQRDERKTTRLEERQNEDFDEEEAEKLVMENEKEEELLSQLAELLGKAVKYSGPLFLRPFTDSLLQPVLGLLRPERPPLDRQVGICIIDDIVEFTGQDSMPLLQHFIMPLVEYMIDANPGVRQAAVYGVGLCAQHGGDQMATLTDALMKRLGQVITHPESRTEENVHATENAIAAWGKFCQFHGHRIDLQQALAHWISWLPVSYDVVESKITYAQLCYFFDKHPDMLLGQGYGHLRHLLDIIACIKDTKLIDDRTNLALDAILGYLRRVVPAEVLQAAFNALSAERKAKLPA